MRARILQADVSSGKTERAIAELLRRLPTDGFAPRIWVLLATRRQEYSFRERLVAAAPQRRSFFNVEFMNFYQLNARLLNLAGWPIRRINANAARGLLRHAVASLRQQGLLSAWESVSLTSGFLRILGDLIIELKQNRVTPEQFSAAARTEKDRMISRIYSQYQELLQRFDLADREGEGWLALEALEQNPDLANDVSLVLVDGYDLFTPVQAQLLARLALHVGELMITLTDLPAAAPIGRRFAQSAERLEQAFSALGIAPQIERLKIDQPPRTPLANLQRLLIERDRSEDALHQIVRVEVPDERAEAAFILRDIRARLLAGARPEQFLVANRQGARYHQHFVTLARQYHVPILCTHGEPLSNNPAVATVLALLRLANDGTANDQADRGFLRRELLDLLRSPYLQLSGLSNDAVEALDQLSQRLKVLGGRQSWLDSLQAMPAALQAAQTAEDDPLLHAIDGKFIDQLQTALPRFFDQVTPPAEGTVASYVAWIEALIGPDPLLAGAEQPSDSDDPASLHILRMLRSGLEDTALSQETRRDIHAIRAMLDLLRGMLRVETLVNDLTGEAATIRSWPQFMSEFTDLIRQAQTETDSVSRSGRVLVTSVTEARGLPHDYVYITGLSEGSFPAHIEEDPLYLDGEREALRQRGVLLMTQSERADDPGLFLELISTARSALMLTRPTILEGKPWNPSFLWQMIEQAVPNARTERYPAGAAPRPEEAATLDEAALAAVAYPEARALRAWFLSEKQRAAYWRRIAQSASAEQSRLNQAANDPHNGSIRSESGLLAIIQQLLDEDRLWSASQFNEFATCPYRFFAKRLLLLEEFEEPEEGMDALMRGTIQHAILEATYQRIRDDRLRIYPPSLEQALQHLRTAIASILPEAPQRLGFLPTPLWDFEQNAIQRDLEALLTNDFCEISPELEERFRGERYVFSVEERFGFDQRPALRIRLGPAYVIRVRGAIDRIDQIGEAFIVVDYKSGSKARLPKAEDMKAGRNYQMLTYLLALDQILQQRRLVHAQVGGGFFLSIRDQVYEGAIWLKQGQRLADVPLVQASLDRLRQAIRQMRAGSFPETPARIEDGKCSRHCEYADLCRIATLGTQLLITREEFDNDA